MIRRRASAAAVALTLARPALAVDRDAEEPDPFSAVAPAAEEPAPPPTAAPRPVALDLALGLRLTHRALRWNDDLFGELRPYTLPLAPWVSLDAQWFPGAMVTRGPLAHLGVYASVGLGLGLSSSDSRGRAYDTSAFDLRGGLRGRIPLGPHALLVGAGLELRRFVLAPPDDPDDPGVPGVSYAAATLDLDARGALAPRLALLAGATGALPFALGDLADRLFPATDGGALEGRAGVAVSLLGGLELRAVGAYRRYFLATHSAPGDRWVAGGLVDEFASFTFSAAWRR